MGATAKTYQSWEMVESPYKRENKWYVKVRSPKHTLPKEVRWYPNVEPVKGVVPQEKMLKVTDRKTDCIVSSEAPLKKTVKLNIVTSTKENKQVQHKPICSGEKITYQKFLKNVKRKQSSYYKPLHQLYGFSSKEDTILCVKVKAGVKLPEPFSFRSLYGGVYIAPKGTPIPESVPTRQCFYPTWEQFKAEGRNATKGTESERYGLFFWDDEE